MISKLAMTWVFCYTAGLTMPQKVRRRSEVASDLHEQRAFSLEHGGGAAALSKSIASRTAKGVFADILWRLDAGRSGEVAIRSGGDPPLPWLSMVFISAVIVAACVGSTQVGVFGSGRVMLAFAGAVGAGILSLGIYLGTHRTLGPICIAAGTLGVAWGFWWTFFVPIGAVLAGISALRRAHRLEALLENA